ncbi:fas-binding factor 1 [Ochlerotatus camptorhynchus]|uniref:fas-binding factor 1 n=1 Tax=Ochlerotatus camptorhynchus TaxID=644619 RepID=UPI0031DC44F6
MNFDLDDPLEGLLSDGSNDSLFGNDTGKKSKKSTTSSKPEVKQSKMEDLFGIKSDAPKAEPPKPVAAITAEKEAPVSLDFSKPPISGQPSSLTSFQTRKTSTPVKKAESTAQRKEITFDDSDVLSDLGFDPKKPKSKSNILDDILGGPIITSSKDIISKQSKNKQSLGVGKDETAGTKSISRQSTETSENLQTESTIMGGYAPSGGGASRRSARRKSSTALHDPLGLFSSPLESKKADKASKKSADWLGLNDDSTSNDPEPIPIPKIEPETPKPVETIKPATPVPPPSVVAPVQTVQAVPVVQSVPVSLTTMLKPDIATGAQTMELLNSETQSALNTMQQQEFQLMVANQMRSQEQALLGMQHKQQAILQKQESQFNDLLQKQIQRHNVLEEVISKQQERINTNIQVMMTQPPHITPLKIERVGSAKRAGGTNAGTNEEDDALKKVELQSDLKRLELEKLRMEDLISNITANHEQEVTLLEQSYRKQMGFLEESLKIMESRMKIENKSLEDFYQEKLGKLEDEKQQLIAAHNKQVQEMEDSHGITVQKLKSNYDESLKNLKSEHREMINNIRESKMLEFSVVQDNQSYMNMLKNASNYLENASGDLQQLRDTLQEQMEFTQKEKDIQLKAREKQLEDQQRMLERSKDAAETEKVRLLNLVEMLEGKLTELSKTSSEEHWTYQQKMVKLDCEKQAFEKEKEFARERIIRDEKRIEELKQIQLEDHSRLVQKIQDERQLLLEEKVKIETLSKIQKKDQLDLSRAEIDAAIKVAEDAAKQADVERERLLQLQRQFETKRRELINQESQLRTKSSELETAISSAKMKELNAENAFKGIKRAEQNLQLKIQLVQRQFREISEREDRLSKEKIAFSKERLELQTIRKRMQTTRCSLCKIGDRSQEMGEYLTAVNNTESVADDRKLEANFFEMQHRDLGKLDQFFDGDVERQLQSFLERNRVEEDDVMVGATNLVPNIAENEDGTIDTDLLVLKFDALKSQNFFGGYDK